MNNILSEKEYQRYIIDQLIKPKCGYVEAPGAEFDRLFAMNRKALFAFLEATQSEKLQALRKIYKEKLKTPLLPLSISKKRGRTAVVLMCLSMAWSWPTFIWN